ncbi:hypothetical protein LguiA_035861 [Lonicera macranthoides]
MNEPPGARMRVGLTARRNISEMLINKTYFYLSTISSVSSKQDLKYLLYWVECLPLGLAAKGIYPAVDPLDSTSTMLQPGIVEVFTGSPGKYVGLTETIRGFQLILSGELDVLPEQAFYLVEVKEIILSTNSGQIGVLPNHAPIATAVDIGILRIRLNDQWVTMALMGGFARIGNNEITVLVNNAEKSSDIDPHEAQQTLEIAEAGLRKAEGKRQTIEANLALRRARTRVETIRAIS